MGSNDDPSLHPSRVLGIGTDIIECHRIAQMIEKHGETFLQRVFTHREILYCSSRKAASQHYAGRWAAKEAALKALGTGWAKGIRWTDIEVHNEVGGKPSIVLANKAEEVATSLGIDSMLLSISHCRAYAIAYVTALGF
jgi:holo-[acyl-carrier protein] synthase